MYSLQSGAYTAAEIEEMLRQDRTVFYEFYLVDKEEHPLGKITAAGAIDYNAEATIQRGASLTIEEWRDIDFFSDRIKPFMCLKTPNGTARFPLGTFLPSSPSRTGGSPSSSVKVECYDKTQILVDDCFPTRYRVAAGTGYISAVAAILSSAGIADYTLEPSILETAADIEFEIGESKISAINKLLKAINYNNLYADARGRMIASPYVAPVNRTVDASYVTDRKSIVFSNAEEQTDFFNAPNQVIRYLETADRAVLISTYTNTDPGSKLSTVSRGRTITDIKAVNDIADQNTLDAYTIREALERSIYQTIQFQSLAMPNHENLDCIYLVNNDLEISGKYIETAWHLEMSCGGKMTHKCRKAVSL